MSLFRPLPLVPYYVQPKYIPLGPTASAVLTVTAGADVLAGAGSFTASAALARTGGNDLAAAAGTFTSPAAIAAAGRNDAALLFGTLNTTPALNGLEQHDAMAAFGTGTQRGSLNYLGISDHFAASATAFSGPTFGEFTFEPFEATFVGDVTRQALSPISCVGRTVVLIQAHGDPAAEFAADDLLTANFYAYGNPVSIFSPAVTWYTAGQTQTGWEQQQIVASIGAGQAALLQPSIRYVLDIFRAAASDPSDTDLVASFTLIAKAPWQP
jgi:hypothetical protein